MTNAGLSLVVAATKERGIGYNGSLPWRLRKDMEFFKSLTTNYKCSKDDINKCIMGRVTWESIPEKFRPLKDRINIVISSKMDTRTDCVVCRSLNEALDWVSKNSPGGHIFCIGGSQLYSAALKHPKLERIFLTLVNSKNNVQLDTFMDPIPPNFKLVSGSAIVPAGVVVEGDFSYEFQVYSIESS